MQVVVVGSGWMGRPAIERMGARHLPHHVISTDVPLRTAIGRLVDEVRPGEGTVIINLAGLRRGTLSDLSRANAQIPEILAVALADSGGHLVHVGSAAEYGNPSDGRHLVEESTCLPTSDYGITKLQGTEAVLARFPTATVLRPFNVVDAQLPDASPMADIRDRIDRALLSGQPVQLIAASTIRDYVSREFVLTSIAEAARQRPAGVFNICSGVGVGTGEITQMVLKDRARTNPVMSSDDSQGSTVIGDPSRWAARTGLAEALGCRGVVDTLRWSVPPHEGPRN